VGRQNGGGKRVFPGKRTEEKRILPAIYPIGKDGLNLAYPAMLENPPRRRFAGFIAHSR
jgi:hypothetical protein